MKFIFPMPNSDPLQSYSLNFRKQKEDNLAWHSRRPASRRLVRSMLQVRLASRKLVQTPSALLPARRLFSHKEPFVRPNASGQLFLPILRVELCQQRSPKWLQDWCVITTKERQSAAALQFDEIKPVLLIAFAKTGSKRFVRSTMASTDS